MVMRTPSPYHAGVPPIPRDLSDPICIGRDFPAIRTNINWAIAGFTILSI